MATLHSGDLSFEFNYTGYAHGWVQYQFYFRWSGESVINDAAFKRWNDYWNDRPPGAFLANEGSEDSLIPFLKKVLETDEADYWQPIEPDIIVAIYPDQFFPFLPSHYTVVYESEELQEAKAARERLKAEKGQLPDDLFTFIVFADAYNLKNADHYYGQGLALHLIVERQALIQFLAELESEYELFRGQFMADEDSSAE